MERSAGDAELLSRSVHEPDVFSELYSRHGLAVRRYVLRRIGDRAGDDLSAEVFVRAFRARSSGKTVRLIDGRYFILVTRLTGNVEDDDLRAIGSAGNVLPANYGPARYRNH